MKKYLLTVLTPFIYLSRSVGSAAKSSDIYEVKSTHSDSDLKGEALVFRPFITT